MLVVGRLLIVLNLHVKLHHIKNFGIKYFNVSSSWYLGFAADASKSFEITQELKFALQGLLFRLWIKVQTHIYVYSLCSATG